jgi:hypothetical protein
MGLIHRAILGACVLLLATPATTQADFPDYWWDEQSTPNWNTPTERGTYPDFPRRCSTTDNASVPSYEVIWVTRQNGDVPIPQQEPTAARNLFDRATSIYAASNKNIGSTSALNLTTPRFVTNDSCGVKFNYETAPDEILRNYAGADLGLGIWSYLEENEGYDPVADNRKYIVVVQWAQAGSNATNGYAGLAEMNSQTRPDASNGNNTGSWLAINLIYGMSNAALNEMYADVVAHEIGHSIGAMHWNMPNVNPNDNKHAGDCADVMCTNRNGFGSMAPGEREVCSSQKAWYRLDCGDNDYWNLAKDPDTAARWWPHFSAFLWGNETLQRVRKNATYKTVR